MKTLLSVFLIFVLFSQNLFSAVSSDNFNDNTINSQWKSVSLESAYDGGSGTIDDPYQIATKENLLLLAATTADYNKYFILTADIDMAGKTFTSAVIAPDTIVDSSFNGTPFIGKFNGNSHVISNLTISTTTGYFVGLFGYISTGSQISNLTLENVNITGYAYVGGLVGWNNNGTLTSCHTSGLVKGTGCVGGLVGQNLYGVLTSCYAAATVTGSSNIGGLVGNNFGPLTSCYTTGTVSGTSDHVGGLVGINYISNLTSCYATGTVHGAGYVGGLVGSQDSPTTILTSCYATGNVTGSDSYVGGLVGYSFSQSPFAFCYATGNVTSTGNYVGGLMGKNASPLESCHADGTVSGNTYVGGLIGWHDYGSIASCYAIGTVGGIKAVGGLAGYSAGNFTSCYATGSVSSSDSQLAGAGGLVGINNNGTVIFCYATGNVTGKGLYVGGLAGRNNNNTNTLIYYCYATGTVRGESNYVGGLTGYNSSYLTACCATGPVNGINYVGGLAGTNEGGITSCYASGTVTGTSYVGGLAGQSYSIFSSYAVGAVSGISYVGGLCGRHTGNPAIESISFWDMQTTSQSVSACGVGKTTAEMQTLSTFTSSGWDFTNETTNGSADIWRMCTDGVDYPRLNWESIEDDFACPDGVNIEDLDYLVQHWLLTNCTANNNYCGTTDLNSSGAVDMADLALFSSHWLEN